MFIKNKKKYICVYSYQIFKNVTARANNELLKLKLSCLQQTEKLDSRPNYNPNRPAAPRLMTSSDSGSPRSSVAP